MCLLKDGTLVSSSKDSKNNFKIKETVRFWDTETHTCKGTLMLHDQNLHSVETMPNGNLVIAKGDTIRFYNPQKEEFEKTLTGHVRPILAV